MQVEVLKKDGQIMFVEAGHDFADLLAETLNRPLGSVAGLASDGSFSNLCKSIEKMRQPVFAGEKKNLLPKAIVMMGIRKEW